MESVTEVWKPVTFYEGIYSVSNLGRVRREIQGVGKRGLYMKPWINAGGYEMVGLTLNGRRVNHRIHRLVAQAFLPERRIDQTDVNHIDGQKRNNHLDNLEWCTPQENVDHYQFRTAVPGVGGPSCGSHHPSAKLSEEDAVIIFRSKLSLTALSNFYGVNRSTIRNIKRRHTWRHITLTLD